MERLCGFASRRNPKRPFLIVSKVLGKHLAADPRQLVDACDSLASRVGNLAGPACVIGLAETATSLGHTFFERWLARATHNTGVFLHTTRYHLDRPLAFKLEESHSHATSHFVYRPESTTCQDLFDQARSLVIVDDEFTTGNTAANLAAAFAKRNAPVEQVVLICLTNWIGQADTRNVCARIARTTGAQVSAHSLLSGDLVFDAAESGALPVPHDSVGTGSFRDGCLPLNMGRLGVSRPLRFDFDAMLAGVDVKREVAVVGTGEFMYPPSLLARWLTERGHDVTIQSSTRSPVVIGGAIQSSLSLVDNYHDGIPNFLYNEQSAVAGPNRTVLVCYETDPIPDGHDLAARLGGHVVFPGRYRLPEQE